MRPEAFPAVNEQAELLLSALGLAKTNAEKLAALDAYAAAGHSLEARVDGGHHTLLHHFIERKQLKLMARALALGADAQALTPSRTWHYDGYPMGNALVMVMESHTDSLMHLHRNDRLAGERHATSWQRQALSVLLEAGVSLTTPAQSPASVWTHALANGVPLAWVDWLLDHGCDPRPGSDHRHHLVPLLAVHWPINSPELLPTYQQWLTRVLAQGGAQLLTPHLGTPLASDEGEVLYRPGFYDHYWSDPDEIEPHEVAWNTITAAALLTQTLEEATELQPAPRRPRL